MKLVRILNITALVFFSNLIVNCSNPDDCGDPNLQVISLESVNSYILKSKDGSNKVVHNENTPKINKDSLYSISFDFNGPVVVQELDNTRNLFSTGTLMALTCIDGRVPK